MNGRVSPHPSHTIHLGQLLADIQKSDAILKSAGVNCLELFENQVTDVSLNQF